MEAGQPKTRPPLDNAIREAEEEGFLIPEAERNTLVQQPRRFAFPIIHFFEWSTYLVQLRANPALEQWPLKTRDFLHEFSEARWFDTNKLPQNTHIGVKIALGYYHASR